ncbi:MAG: GntR family transcriptional regulator [Desulfobulbaceae bacterium]|nr:GntR family transcriptional regulator [Desulfobulbaceae bacterium]
MLDIKKHTYTDLVVTYIKQGILNGTYKPGTKVKELTIAQQLSISRAPIREALQILIKEGLIVWLPQKGKFITELTPKQIRDSYFTGGILEAAAVSTSLHKYTEKDIQKLTKIADQMKEVAEHKAPLESIAALDDKFHKVLFSRIDNEFVIEFCRRSCQGLSKFLFFNYWLKLYSPSEVYARHKVIIDALKKANAAELEKQIRQHYFDAGERMAIVSHE